MFIPLLMLALGLISNIQSAPTDNVGTHAVSALDKDESVTTASNALYSEHVSSDTEYVPPSYGHPMLAAYGGYVPSLYRRYMSPEHRGNQRHLFGGPRSPPYGEYGPSNWEYVRSSFEPFPPRAFGNAFNNGHVFPLDEKTPATPIPRRVPPSSTKIGPISYDTEDSSLFEVYDSSDEETTSTSDEDDTATSIEQGSSEVSETLGTLADETSGSAHSKLNF